MIEVLFGESEAGTMKAIKENKVVFRSDKERFTFIGSKTKTLKGNSSEVICLPFMLDLGEIKLSVDSQKRKDFVYEMYMQSGWDSMPEVQEELRLAIDQYVREQKRLMDYVKQGEEFRVWYSDTPYSLSGFYYFCNLLKNHTNEITVVKLPEYRKTLKNEILEYISWGEVNPQEMHKFLVYERKISSIEKVVFADKWQELVQDNSPLRAIISKTLVGVREDFYDFLIDKYISYEPIKECKLIGDIMGNNPLGVSDYWYAYRIEEMIQKGKIKIVEDSTKKYARTICLA